MDNSNASCGVASPNCSIYRPIFYIPSNNQPDDITSLQRKSNEVSLRQDARDNLLTMTTRLVTLLPDLQKHLTKADKVEFKQYISEILESL